MSLLDYELDWEEVVSIWRSYKKQRPFSLTARPKKRPTSRKGKELAQVVEEVEVDDDEKDELVGNEAADRLDDDDDSG
ncbi:hypothetical protein CLOM_g15769 [Closterium sp. NIES-68]|nr:hypothetical protein CLOM_g24288 [Closterium sp. NIES-68]GJP56716.1 hypothetical protein CLOM_g15769 [Closterium sp. NIES-68]GJP84880.1 hypothetical protein CLOP_g14926 [Closterium sp. NIES-67]